MTLSYNWISEYIPIAVDAESLGSILTSIGLEVESAEDYESVRGALKGLLVGEVKDCTQHPSADKLKVTKVDVGNGDLLQIVCGAPNVAVGQKVVVALPGSTIYPLNGEPITLKTARIRGIESFGMICAEDEIGIGQSHEGIIVLPSATKPGTNASDHFKVYTDRIFEIGLTPNRMDAMSHIGVAKDVCAYLNHHEKKDVRVNAPVAKALSATSNRLVVDVRIENTNACKRYCGISIINITVGESPEWLKNKLQSIGQRPINNIVDITNYILHDTGQPLHAFDADKIAKHEIVVKNLPQDAIFKTLDGKERKLSNEDLMICDGDDNGLCIAGVFGGADSGVTNLTKNIFLESAWFHPVDIRKTSFRHGLRTDAAARFEKNVDISTTHDVMIRAAQLIVEICGGEIGSDPVDIHPYIQQKKRVVLEFSYLKKLSGKDYQSGEVRKILQHLGFEVISEDSDRLEVSVPYSKPDITLQADLVEEVMRIDGYDNIAIPTSINITPAVGAMNPARIRKERTASYLAAQGFNEILTNSITNDAWFGPEELGNGVRLLNNLSAAHNIMRPSMLETGLESVAYNLNRKNNDIKFFEFGYTYQSSDNWKYSEVEHLCLYVSGSSSRASWKGKAVMADIFYLRGVVEGVLDLVSPGERQWAAADVPKLSDTLTLQNNNEIIVELGRVSKAELGRFDIKQEVYFADIRWQKVLDMASNSTVSFKPLPNQLPVYRDLAMVVERSMPFQTVETAIKRINLTKLHSVKLFDVFESERLGAGKKSFAVNFTFSDESKTLTDKEIDGMMNKIMRTLEQDLSAEIRKG